MASLTKVKLNNIDTSITFVYDPLVLLNYGSTLANTDIGFVFNRDGGINSNVALFWNESNDRLTVAYTNATGLPNSNIAITKYANVAADWYFGNLAGGTTNTVWVSANVLPTANAFYNFGSPTQRWNVGYFAATTLDLGGSQISVDPTNGFKFVIGGSGTPIYLSGNGAINGTTLSSATTLTVGTSAAIGTNLTAGGYINAVGNVVAASGVFNSLTVNGNESVTGYLNVTGNVLSKIGTFNELDLNGYLNATGNVLAAGGVFNALTVNGNHTSTGFVNTSGNVSAATGQFGSINSTGLINTTANVSASMFNGGQIYVSGLVNAGGNVLAQIATFNRLDVNGNVELGAITTPGAGHSIIGNVQQSGAGTVWINTPGNLLAALGRFGQISSDGLINTSANVLAATGRFGTVLSDGFINTSANISAATYIGGQVVVSTMLNTAGNVLTKELDVFGNAQIGSLSTAGVVHDIIGNIRQTGAGTVFFNTTGNISAALGYFGTLRSDGYINTTANISTAQLNAGQVNTTGNVLATVGTFNALTVNGNESVTGFLNVTGNILGAGGILNSLTVNGNESVTGYLNVTGNVLAAVGVFGAVNSTGYINTTGNISTAVLNTAQLNAGQINTAGNVLAQVGRFNELDLNGYLNSSGNILATGGVFNALAVNGSITSTGFINTSGNISAAIARAGTITTTGTLTAALVNSTGNVLATGGTFNALTVNGNESITGFLNVTGNVIAAVAEVGSVESSGVIYANSTNAATSAITGAIITAGGIGVAKDSHFGGNVSIDGNLFVHGNVTFFSSNDIVFSDALIYLADDNPADILDIGFVSSFTNPGYQHTGFVRDATDGIWKLFANVVAEPTTTVDFTNATYSSLLIGNLLASQATVSGLNSAGFINTSGNISAATVRAGQINTTGNVLSVGGVFNSVTVNGTALVQNLNSTTNVLAQSATVNSLTVNGNESITGFLNVTGNVLAAVGRFNEVDLNGYLNSSGNILATGGVFNSLQVNGSQTVTATHNTLQANIRNGDTSVGYTKAQVAFGYAGTDNYAHFIHTKHNAGGIHLNTIDFYTSNGAITGTLASSIHGLTIEAGRIGVGGITAPTSNLHVGGNARIGTDLVVDRLLSVAGNVILGLTQASAINNTPIGNATASTGAFTTLSATQTLYANSTTPSTSQTTGAIVVAGGVGITGNISAGDLATPGAQHTLWGNVQINAIGSIQVPVGDTLQRPTSGIAGQIRFNTDTNQFEGYSNVWGAISGGGGGGGTPGGVTSTIQYNNGGAFGGIATMNYILANGAIIISSGISSTTTATGALQIIGGVGITENINVGGTIRSTGAINTSANVLASQVSAGSVVTTGVINTAGNVLATAGIFNSLSVNGNIAIGAVTIPGAGHTIVGNITQSGPGTTYFNIVGNILATEAKFGTLGLTGTLSSTAFINTTANVSAAIGVFGAINSTGFINTSGNVSAGTVRAGQINTTGNVLAQAGVFNSLTVNGNETVTGFLNVTGNIIAANIDAGGVRQITSNAAPAIKTVGDQWYDTTSDTLFQYVYDGTSFVWVDISGQPLNVNIGTVQGTSLSITGAGAVTGALTVNAGNNATAIINGGTNGVGNIGASGQAFNTLFAKASSALYADLAEKYLTDDDYKSGTVLIFGGEYEVTLSTTSHDTRVAGVVTTNPGFIMNESLENSVSVALTGRVPCWVKGPVNKGDRIVASDTPGVAQKLDISLYEPGCIIGKSLESIDTDKIVKIEIAIGRF